MYIYMYIYLQSNEKTDGKNQQGESRRRTFTDCRLFYSIYSLLGLKCIQIGVLFSCTYFLRQTLQVNEFHPCRMMCLHPLCTTINLIE